jgi:O-antigen chain-terminating methyltransferase
MDDFYKNFEDRFRGSRETIKARLEVYLPFIHPLLAEYPSGGVFDLGCGRGEWLELTQELGFSSRGVDLDEGMLRACKEKNLNAIWGDAFENLSKLDDESQVIVSAFHVVEHIDLTELRQWVSEALRVLKPGGLLILETPNTENLNVASQSFYLDPTHLRPIPSALLSFILENAGFGRVKTLRLQESKELTLDSEVKLRDVFFSVSPDYSVIGQKTGPKSKTEIVKLPK